ncbi:hypothetical protein [Nocardioides sp.]|uniref:hypothetical protein n=1 Tax=Nocardioides sp. TaxID=35761 RepID=UPI002B819409|nr:hypothetical protein [Nocardioides sp.]HXH80720.1 hypothetical protein [Nocardioides sp.]
MRSRRVSGACLRVGYLLLLGASFLWFDNVGVDVSASDFGDSGPAGRVGCSIAPWDAGLNDNRDAPGGEHTGAYSNEVAAECYSASSTRFNAAVGSGVLGLLMLSVGAVVAVGSMRDVMSA